MYPGMAKAAREEGFDDIAEWFETLAKAEKSHAGSLPEGARHARLLSRTPERETDARRLARDVARCAATRRGVVDGRASRDDHERHSREARRSRPATSPNDPRYWDARDLEAELQRVFQICHECRMCVATAASFPDLFARVDRDIETRARRGRRAARRRRLQGRRRPLLAVQALLHQVPLHGRTRARRELLDFPRLMAREKAQRARSATGVTLGRSRSLGEPRLHRRARLGPARAARRTSSTRTACCARCSEKVIGISAEFPLPPFARAAVRDVARRSTSRSPGAGERGRGRASSRPATATTTCPSVPRRRGARARAQRLRGRPAPRTRQSVLLRHAEPRRRRRRRGDGEGRAQRRAAPPARARGPARSSCPGPTCAYTMKKEWPEYVGTPEAQRGRRGDVRPDGVPRRAPPREEAQDASSRRRSARSRTTPPATCARRRSASPGARVLGARPRHRGAHGRAVLGRRRHLGDEGGALRDWAASTRRSWCAASRTPSRSSSSPTARSRRSAS